MANFKVCQRTKEVIVYRKSILEDEYKIVDRYKDAGYVIKMLEKKAPRKKSGVSRDDLKTYLKGKIDNNIYREMETHIAHKENFLTLKAWLKNELKKDAEKNNKTYFDFETYIKQRKKLEDDASQKQQDEAKKNAENEANNEIAVNDTSKNK